MIQGSNMEEEREDYEGFSSMEIRDLRMLQAALYRKPELFGSMNEAQRKEYEDTIREIEEQKKMNPNAEFDVYYD